MRAILTWHSIDSSGSPISTSREEFRRQVEWLIAGPVEVVSVEKLLALPDDASAAALSFDDGFANFETEAAPLLASHGLPVTLFIVTGHVGQDNRWPGANGNAPTLPLLGWETLGKMQAQGVAMGSHGRSHRRLPDLSDAELEEELGQAADEMERRLGERPAGFAYPYGGVNQRVSSRASEHYRWACTTVLRAVERGSNPLLLPRIDAWYLRNPHRLGTWGSATFRTWIWMHRQARRARGH